MRAKGRDVQTRVARLINHARFLTHLYPYACTQTYTCVPWTLASLAVQWLLQTKGNHVMEFEAVAVEPGAMLAQFQPSYPSFGVIEWFKCAYGNL